MLLTACGTNSNPQTNNETPEDESTSGQQTEITLDALLNDIQNAVPGTAGSSLKQAKAAGELLDWSQSGNMVENAQVQEWIDTQSTLDRASLAYAYAGVLDFADSILLDPIVKAEELSDAGYTLQYDTYKAEFYQGTANALSPLFTQLFEEKTTPYAYEKSGNYQDITMEQLSGIWYDSEMREMLIFTGDTCRPVIPYLDYYGEKAYAARVRDRSASGYCPALEIDTWEEGDFSGATVYYISGLDEVHFWGNTQGMRFDKIPDM